MKDLIASRGKNLLGQKKKIVLCLGGVKQWIITYEGLTKNPF